MYICLLLSSQQMTITLRGEAYNSKKILSTTGGYYSSASQSTLLVCLAEYIFKVNMILIYNCITCNNKGCIYSAELKNVCLKKEKIN